MTSIPTISARLGGRVPVAAPVAIAALLMSVAGLGGCATDRSVVPVASGTGSPGLVVERLGGRHAALAVDGDWWVQAVGGRLLRVDPATLDADPIAELAPPGGPAIVDLLADGDRLLAVLEDEAVVELDWPPVGTGPGSIGLRRRVEAETLGVRPRRLSRTAAGTVWVGGPDGVARFGAPDRGLLTDGAAGPVVESAAGPVTTVGRRILRVGDGGYVGSASLLAPLPAGAATGGATLLAVRSQPGGATASLMDGDLRELDAIRGVHRTAGPVRRLRPGAGSMGGTVLAITDAGIEALAAEGTTVTAVRMVEFSGVRDVAALPGDRLAACGDFGRAVLAAEGPAGGAGGDDRPGTWRIEAIARRPAGLTWATSDGRFLLTGGPSGALRIDLEGRIEPADPALAAAARAAGPATEAVVAAGRVRIVEGGTALAIEAGGRTRAVPLDGDRATCVASVDGAIWIGGERSIRVLEPGPGPSGSDAIVARADVDGPVLALRAAIDDRGVIGAAAGDGPLRVRLRSE